MHKRTFLLMMSAFIILLTGCEWNNSPNDDTPVDALSLNKENIVIEIGHSEQLSADV